MLKTFFVSLAVFLAIDLIWLGFVAKSFYNQQLVGFSRTLNWPVAFLSYLLIILGLNLFVFPKATDNSFEFFKWGFLFGVIAYGVYDLVNLATLADWTIKMTVVDILWGGLVCGLVSLITYLII